MSWLLSPGILIPTMIVDDNRKNHEIIITNKNCTDQCIQFDSLMLLRTDVIAAQWVERRQMEADDTSSSGSVINCFL